MSTFRILVAEDDENDAFFLQRVVRQLQSEPKIEARIASDGEELIRRLVTARPDLVLLDLKMPALDGFDTLLQIREQKDYSELPVVILSSSVLPSDVAKARRLGANGFIQKPTHAGDLAIPLLALLAAINAARPNISGRWLIDPHGLVAPPPQPSATDARPLA